MHQASDCRLKQHLNNPQQNYEGKNKDEDEEYEVASVDYDWVVGFSSFTWCV